MKLKTSKLIITILALYITFSSETLFGMTVSASTDISQNIIVNRIFGPNRYCTSTELINPESTTLIVANGTDFADALSASALAVKENASIVLVEQNSIPYNLMYQLDTYINNYNKIIIVGGTGVVSTEVENQLKNIVTSNVVRLAGINRYETSLRVAEYIGNFDGAFITTGLDFADALSSGSIAATKGYPIILTDGETISSNAVDLVKSNTDNVYILGGPTIVSDNVKNNFSNATRLAGKNRYETNKFIVDLFKDTLNTDVAYVTTGLDFPDALSVSAVAGRNNSPIILTGSDPDSYTKSIISDINTKELIVISGPAVITPLTMEELAGRQASTNSNGTKPISELKELALSKGYTSSPYDSDKLYLYLIDSDNHNLVSTGFIDNITSSRRWDGYAETMNLFTIDTIDPITYKDDFIGFLKMALPNSYESLYNLICTNKDIPDQELYLDGKRVVITNTPSNIQLSIYYSNSTFKYEL